MIIIKKTCYR